MPLVAHNKLPTFQRLRDRGQDVLSVERARHQDIRELHIGLLNMMPDAALAATEYQFMRLVGACNQIVQFYIYPFSIPELDRGPEALKHIKQHYFEFAELQEQGLDALIITGANVASPSLDEEPFWNPLIEIVQWANENVASILCSCLATHALVKFNHGIERQRLPQKKWGVYSHKINAPEHPLTWEINTRFFRIIYFQGHPEYDAISLLKEYKREVLRYIDGALDDVPPFPENYFSAEAGEIASGFITAVQSAKESGDAIPQFPDARLQMCVDNTWGDTGKAIINNWLGLVYQLTNLDRRKQFMHEVNPEDPLGMNV